MANGQQSVCKLQCSPLLSWFEQAINALLVVKVYELSFSWTDSKKLFNSILYMHFNAEHALNKT